MSNNADVILTLKNWMAETGTTYDEIASKTGTTRQNIWLKLNKGTAPSFSTVYKIVKALGGDVEVDPPKRGAKKQLEQMAVDLEDELASFEVVRSVFRVLGYNLVLVRKD